MLAAKEGLHLKIFDSTSRYQIIERRINTTEPDFFASTSNNVTVRALLSKDTSIKRIVMMLDETSG